MLYLKIRCFRNWLHILLYVTFELFNIKRKYCFILGSFNKTWKLNIDFNYQYGKLGYIKCCLGSLKRLKNWNYAVNFWNCLSDFLLISHCFLSPLNSVFDQFISISYSTLLNSSPEFSAVY